MGGMVGQGLAIRHPELVRGLVIANSASRYPDAARPLWAERIAKVEQGGLEAIADMVIERYFSAGFRARSPRSWRPRTGASLQTIRPLRGGVARGPRRDCSIASRRFAPDAGYRRPRDVGEPSRGQGDAQRIPGRSCRRDEAAHSAWSSAGGVRAATIVFCALEAAALSQRGRPVSPVLDRALGRSLRLAHRKPRGADAVCAPIDRSASSRLIPAVATIAPSMPFGGASATNARFERSRMRATRARLLRRARRAPLSCSMPEAPGRRRTSPRDASLSNCA